MTAEQGNPNEARGGDFAIVRATPDDIDRLMQVRAEAIRDIFGPAGEDGIDEVLASTEAYYRRAIPTGEHVAALVLVHGQTVGCGGVCLYDELPAPTNPSGACAFVMNVYVVAQARRQGIGRALVSWLVREARSRGACKVYLEASGEGAPLYESLGFRPMGGMMRLEDAFVHRGDAMHARPQS